MPSQIEARIGKLENSLGAGSARVVVIFDDDDRVVPEGATVIRVLFAAPEDRHDDQA